MGCVKSIARDRDMQLQGVWEEEWILLPCGQWKQLRNVQIGDNIQLYNYSRDHFVNGTITGIQKFHTGENIKRVEMEINEDQLREPNDSIVATTGTVFLKKVGSFGITRNFVSLYMLKRYDTLFLMPKNKFYNVKGESQVKIIGEPHIPLNMIRLDVSCPNNDQPMLVVSGFIIMI